MFDQELLEENAPVLKLVADTLIRDPKYSIDLLDIIARRLLLPKYRQERDCAKNITVALEKATGALWCSQNDPEDLVALAQLLAKEEHLDEALGYLEKPLELCPNNGEYHRFKTSLLERQHKFKEALISLKRAEELLPHLKELQVDQKRIEGRLLLQLIYNRDHAPHLAERIEAAREIIILKKQLERSCADETMLPSPKAMLSADLLEDMMVLVHLLSQKEVPENRDKITEAISLLDQIIEQQPKKPAHYCTRIRLLIRLRKYTCILRTFSKACQLHLQKLFSRFQNSK